jgi:hypothetical protein
MRFEKQKRRHLLSRHPSKAPLLVPRTSRKSDSQSDSSAMSSCVGDLRLVRDGISPRSHRRLISLVHHIQLRCLDANSMKPLFVLPPRPETTPDSGLESLTRPPPGLSPCPTTPPPSISPRKQRCARKDTTRSQGLGVCLSHELLPTSMPRWERTAPARTNPSASASRGGERGLPGWVEYSAKRSLSCIRAGGEV